MSDAKEAKARHEAAKKATLAKIMADFDKGHAMIEQAINETKKEGKQ